MESFLLFQYSYLKGKSFPLPVPMPLHYAFHLAIQRNGLVNSTNILMRKTCISRRVMDALFYMLEGDKVKTVNGWCAAEHEAVTEPPRGLGVLYDSSFQRLSRWHDHHSASVSSLVFTLHHCRLAPAVWHHLGTPGKSTANHCCTAPGVSTDLLLFWSLSLNSELFCYSLQGFLFSGGSLTASINVMRNQSVK